jgi:signal transduction histidine kinase
MPDNRPDRRTNIPYDLSTPPEQVFAFVNDLRNPLSAIEGWARLLAAGHLDDEESQQAIKMLEELSTKVREALDHALNYLRKRAEMKRSHGE